MSLMRDRHARPDQAGGEGRAEPHTICATSGGGEEEESRRSRLGRRSAGPHTRSRPSLHQRGKIQSASLTRRSRLSAAPHLFIHEVSSTSSFPPPRRHCKGNECGCTAVLRRDKVSVLVIFRGLMASSLSAAAAPLRCLAGPGASCWNTNDRQTDSFSPPCPPASGLCVCVCV